MAHCERHRKRLADLHAEAHGIAAELADQLQSNVEAAAAAMQAVDAATDDEQEQAALAKKHECEEHIEALKKQHAEQQRQVEEIEHQLGTADAKLAQLRSQRDVLKARLRSAEARQQLEGGRPRAKRPRWVLMLAITGWVIAGFSLLLLLPDLLQQESVEPEHADARSPELVGPKRPDARRCLCSSRRPRSSVEGLYEVH